MCAVCRRSSDGLDAWHEVLHLSLVEPDEWEETFRIEVCSWACLRHAFMAAEPGENDPEAWKGN